MYTYVYTYMYIYVYTYMYIYILYIHMCIYIDTIYVYTERVRNMVRRGAGGRRVELRKCCVHWLWALRVLRLRVIVWMKILRGLRIHLRISPRVWQKISSPPNPNPRPNSAHWRVMTFSGRLFSR